MSTEKEKAEHEVTYLSFESKESNYYLIFEPSSAEFWVDFYAPNEPNDEIPELRFDSNSLKFDFLDEDKGELGTLELSTKRQKVITVTGGVEKLAEGMFSSSAIGAVVTGIGGFFHPPLWGWTVNFLWTMAGSLAGGVTVGAVASMLHRTRYVRFSCVSKDLPGIRWGNVGKVKSTGRMPKKHYEKMPQGKELGGKLTKEEEALLRERFEKYGSPV